VIAKLKSETFIYSGLLPVPMRAMNSIFELPFIKLFESLLADFILAFAFFTALIYAVLGKRFDHQRSAIAMSCALGLALSVGLVWWEQQNGLSIRNLGPVAIGFAVILLGMVMFQGIRQTGGSWAGAGIAFGGSILVAWVLGFQWPVASEIIQAIAVVALTVGVLAFLLHSHGITKPGANFCPVTANNDQADIRHDMSNLYDDNKVGKRLEAGFGRLRQQAKSLAEHPKYATDMAEQIRRILPAEGWLTRRLAKLREHTHLIKKGHLHRIDELKDAIRKMPAAMKKNLKAQLHETIKELHIDKRLERLDKAVAENERRIRNLTIEAGQALGKQDYAHLDNILKDAERLQFHNDKLLKAIMRTEKKLFKAAADITKKMPGAS